MNKLIIAPDSLKGTLSAGEFCEIVARTARRVWPECRVISLPLADGGEGTVDCFVRSLNARRVTAQVTGPFYGEQVAADYAIAGETAILETASTAGLPLVEGREEPTRATTFGLGELMRDALRRGCRRIVLGLGGSCTNDCGVGLARGLGAVFYDHAGRPFVPMGDTLDRIGSYDLTQPRQLLSGAALTAMCDIDTPPLRPPGRGADFLSAKGRRAGHGSPAGSEFAGAGGNHRPRFRAGGTKNPRRWRGGGTGRGRSGLSGRRASAGH